MLQRDISGYGYALLTAALWSLIGPVARICFAEGIGPLEVAFWRAVVGGLCFALHAAWRGELAVPVRDGACFCVFGLVGISMFFAVFQMSVKEAGAALAVVLMYTAPAWVALFSRMFFHERLSARKMTALGVAMCGTLLVCLSGGSLAEGNSFLGIVCGLAAGFFYATHYPFYAWWQKKYSTATLYAYMLFAGAIGLFPFVTFAPVRSPAVWGALLSLGLVSTYGAYLCYGQGLRRISPVRAAVVSNFEPVLGTFLAWLFWGEMFSALGWVGSALVLAAVFLLTTDRDGGAA